MKHVLTATTLVVSIAWCAAAAATEPKKSREDVRGEAASAAKANQLDTGDATRVAPAASLRSRAEVKAETPVAVKTGAIGHGEVAVTPASAPAVVPSVKSRAEVKAEAASAIGARPLKRSTAPAVAASVAGK